MPFIFKKEWQYKKTVLKITPLLVFYSLQKNYFFLVIW
jgi:hypothetical protein